MMLIFLNLTVLISADDNRARQWSRGDCDSNNCDGVGVIWMQREHGEVSAQGDMAIHVPSVHFRHIDQIVLD